MLIVSVDPSLSKMAVVVWRDDIPVAWRVFRTGESKCKKKLQSVQYFDSVHKQINYLTTEVISFIKLHGKPDYIFSEGLSFGSKGDRTRDLAMVYGVFVEKCHVDLGLDFDKIIAYAPTSIKAVARDFLPKEEQTFLNDKGKPLKIVMDKPMMMSIAEKLHPEVLKGYVKSAASEKAGYEDLSDAVMVFYTGKTKLKI